MAWLFYRINKWNNRSTVNCILWKKKPRRCFVVDVLPFCAICDFHKIDFVFLATLWPTQNVLTVVFNQRNFWIAIDKSQCEKCQNNNWWRKYFSSFFDFSHYCELIVRTCKLSFSIFQINGIFLRTIIFEETLESTYFFAYYSFIFGWIRMNGKWLIRKASSDWSFHPLKA